MRYIVSISIILLVGIMFLFLLPASAQDQKTSEWTGKLANGQTITKEDLSKIIREHEEWLSSEGKHGKKADLSGASLWRANLSKANLSKAILCEADLSEVDLSEADLSEANLNFANLSRAFLSRANLYKADLFSANLSEAYLSMVNFKGAEAIFTDFSYSWFQPENIEELIFLGAKGFSTIRFHSFKAVVKLRKIAKEAGLRSEERALTSSLHKYRMRAVPFHEQIFEYYLFGLPTDFGASPWRSFYVLVFFIIIFSCYYIVILKKQEKDSRGKDGIHKIWIKERVRKDLGKKKPITRLTLCGWAVLRVGLYFSVLSAFNIGWRELNVGNWIARIQRREYIYRATGWTRTVSGIQSLLSVYLLALWALTYFGRPFE